uniref:Uncharacterized protein n=1 Tax=Pipistrellus kuhlii TaxID=59472 RepID=A0A7J7Y9L0_PIPKU|nr:hypothetical protein mPipKuh1_010340 [Pipistrellus kuhlii]
MHTRELVREFVHPELGLQRLGQNWLSYIPRGVLDCERVLARLRDPTGAQIIHRASSIFLKSKSKNLDWDWRAHFQGGLLIQLLAAVLSFSPHGLCRAARVFSGCSSCPSTPWSESTERERETPRDTEGKREPSVSSIIKYQSDISSPPHFSCLKQGSMYSPHSRERD